MNYSVTVEEQINQLTLNLPPDLHIEAVTSPSELIVATEGIQGPIGYSLLSGDGYPSTNLGRNNDLYVNLDNGYFYKKINNAWEYQFYVQPQSKRIDISSQDILNKYIILDPIPNNPDQVTLRFIGGTDQENGVDFKVVGNVLSWAANPSLGVTGMEGFISNDDIVIVQY